MERVPVRHKRATAPLDEEARARLWGSVSAGSSSCGSDRSAEGSSPELAELVFDSLYGEKDETELGEDSAAWARRRDPNCGGRWRVGDGLGWSETEMLEGLVSLSLRDRVGCRIKAEAESAWGRIGRVPGEEEKGTGTREWKGRLMWWLREKEFDAGLCECRCEKTARLPAVVHEYVDVLADGGAARYIVEPNLAAEFEIARPTPRYRELLDVLPAVFVGRPEALRDIVRLMCSAAAESMKSRELHVPPWRRRQYVQGKWFGPYKRTTSRAPKVSAPAPADSPGRAVAGSSAAAGVMGYQQSIYYCRVDCGRRERLKGGKLSMGL